jgi:hypothetical protein
VSLSLDHQLVRTFAGLREKGMRLTFLYVVGASFAGVKDGAGAGSSSLLPFLPPRNPAGVAPDGTALPGPTQPDPRAGVAPAAQVGLSPEARSLLLSLSSAGVPCLTLSHGDDLIRTLSLWGTGRRRVSAQ